MMLFILLVIVSESAHAHNPHMIGRTTTTIRMDIATSTNPTTAGMSAIPTTPSPHAFVAKLAIPILAATPTRTDTSTATPADCNDCNTHG